MVLINYLVVGGDEPYYHIFEVQASPEETPTFTVEESGLSQQTGHQLHILVKVPAERISPSNSSNSGLSDILMGEPPAKRLHTEGSGLGKSLKCSIYNPPISRQYHHSESEEQQPSGDVLPGEPFISDADTLEQLLVRAEYIRVFDAVIVTREVSQHAPCSVRLVNLCLGKSSWISYALRYCLGQKRPVVWYRYGICFFFSGSGVVIIDPLVHQSGGKHTWCFVDSMDASETLPHHICSPGIQLFPVYVTSPKESRWRKLVQSRRIPELIVMNPWTLDKLETAARFYPDRILEDIHERYHNAGPSARVCLTFDSEAIKDFYTSRDQQIKNTATAESLGKFIDESDSLFMDQFSHKICVMRRFDHNIMNSYTVNPVTDFVRRQLLIQIGKIEQNGCPQNVATSYSGV
ncbi:hypothetical protein BU17DRAFT_87528 [Hysterangium stoloniferum]|nr:hypothetical protein BU17DRAFT_87528 [Hysterangium stoloniferum]